jgi:hypothetical protein
MAASRASQAVDFLVATGRGDNNEPNQRGIRLEGLFDTLNKFDK